MNLKELTEIILQQEQLLIEEERCLETKKDYIQELEARIKNYREQLKELLSCEHEWGEVTEETYYDNFGSDRLKYLRTCKLCGTTQTTEDTIPDWSEYD
jgi:hypothetical protein